MSRVSFQVVAIIFLVATAFFLWDFSQRVLTNVRLAQSEKQLEQSVADEEAKNKDLREQKQRVQTDAYVEDFVRRNWHWAKPEDTVVIPQITALPTPVPSAPESAPLPAKPWWQDWFDFLFGP
jgi:hypothetical protein